MEAISENLDLYSQVKERSFPGLLELLDSENN